MKLFYKKKCNIVTILVLALVLQVTVPVAGTYVYADKGNGDGFKITNLDIVEDKATIDWELTVSPEDGAKNYTHEVELMLKEGQSGDLVAGDGNIVGTYFVSEEGAIIASIYAGDELIDIVESEISTGSSATLESRRFKGSIVLKKIVPNVSLLGTDTDTNFDDVSQDVIHTVIAKQKAEGEPIQELGDYYPKMGDELWVEIYFSFEGGHNYGPGSTLIYQLPEPLKAASGSGPLNEEGVNYADFEVVDGRVIITFNENIRQYYDGGKSDGLPIVEGYFGIYAKFESDNKDLEQDVELPNKDVEDGKIKIKIEFKPKEGSALDKTVSSSKDGPNETNYQNTKKLYWTVYVNGEMRNLGRGEEFKDTLSGNHRYGKNSLEIERYKVDADGNIVDGTKEGFPSDKWTQLTGEESTFSVMLEDKWVYKINYTTIPGDTENAYQELNNRAEFPETAPKEISVKIEYGKPLEKIGEAIEPKGNTKWTVTVNANEKVIEPATIITDTWTQGHKLSGDVNSIIVEGIDSQEYSIVLNENGLGFVLTLNKQVSSKFTITYTTKLVDENGIIDKDISITNKVTRSDRTDNFNDTNKTVGYSQNVISKGNFGPNYQDKTVDWEIVINQARYVMTGDIILTDTFASRNLKIEGGSFAVRKDGVLLEPTSYTLTHKIDGDEKSGFILTILNIGDTTSRYTVTYTTDYDIKGVQNPEPETYRNTAKVKWITNGKEYTSKEVESTVSINTEQKKNGYKKGNYNYEDKKFTWEIVFNYNFNTISKPILKDKLPDWQVIDKDSIKVYKLTLKGNGDIAGTEELDTNQYDLSQGSISSEFQIVFKEAIDSPYQVKYTSTTKND